MRGADGGARLCSHSAAHSFSNAAVVFIEFEKGLLDRGRVFALTHTTFNVLKTHGHLTERHTIFERSHQIA